LLLSVAFAILLLYSDSREPMRFTEPNQAGLRGIVLSTAIILNTVVGLIIIGVGITGSA
jgi:hypothetical protein